jgi:hypothetical protein
MSRLNHDYTEATRAEVEPVLDLGPLPRPRPAHPPIPA